MCPVIRDDRRYERERRRKRKSDLRKILTSQPTLRSEWAEAVCLKLGIVVVIQIVHSPITKIPKIPQGIFKL